MFRANLTDPQQTVLELLSRIGEARTFYLAGGTALALFLGHRRSNDFEAGLPKVSGTIQVFEKVDHL